MDLPKQLNYERSLFPSKAVFFYKTDDCDFIPLQAEVNRIRGQKSSVTEGFTSNGKPKPSAAASLAHCNPLIIEECYVPPTVTDLYCRFSLRVQANSLKPLTCNSPEVGEILHKLASEYKRCGGYLELAERYAKNVLLGTWLWRNQNTSATCITIVTSKGSTFEITDTRELTWESRWPKTEAKTLEKLTAEIACALSDPKVFWCADISAKLRVAFCQEVFPSQLFSEKSAQGDVSKQYAKAQCPDGSKAVSFNTVKVGAALQLIDDWWGISRSQRLRVHEYGADKEHCIAQRSPETERDFYSLVTKAEDYIADLASLEPGDNLSNDIHFVMSVLVKAGLFQKGSKS